MAPRLITRRILLHPTVSRPRCLRSFANQSRLTTTTNRSRPILPFLFIPRSSPNSVRRFTSERQRWWKHEAKLVVRYTLTLWGAVICVLTIFFAINEEIVEREFPTPHEWHYLTRKFLRDANNFKDPKNGEINWARALELSRGVVIRLEDVKTGGQDVVKLSDIVDLTLEVPGEFIACDISAKSEEWRRGYFEAIMLAAKAAEHVDGWQRDITRNIVTPPEFVIGPSNPHPTPIPPGNPSAPREEDCETAYPSADNWYTKILATKGLSPRQKMEASLEYASFMEFKNNPEGAESLYKLALAEATSGIDPKKLPYDPRTLILKERAGPPSMNVLDALTATANHIARKGDISSALPIYLSILKARRSLSDDPPRTTSSKPKVESFSQQILKFFAPPEYPPPPPDGTQPPWRSTLERCQEAALNLYIGEILYATGSRDEGLAWTRDGVDLAEEQLRSPKLSQDARETKSTCRNCLSTGLDNWSIMVSRLAKEEKEKKATGSQTSMFSFWSGPSQETEGRWEAEEVVIQDRVKRTRELLEDIQAPKPGIVSFFKV
ncbi:uncharacterized protein TRIVIDRAFT_44161 [Trichoderma virens Gv29-8]|uniref:MFS maltose permease n=1 Tax=Hypocrea virens (strain Gv29-8 / FGSC 10586) TaxID=413071 RepID=G9N3S3_HYPVG|nr:uncharacterized protein TRIVIDRAFT_44161 [Trichoderma virens Gv29-8]EHK18956.1 hypothetical protein TRIVIDRAFT_44161 [Trichoderma virens Gv29-8]